MEAFSFQLSLATLNMKALLVRVCLSLLSNRISSYVVRSLSYHKLVLRVVEEGAELPEDKFPDGGPTALAEFFGDVMLVNGE